MAFTEVNAPEQFKFEKPGDSVEGVLLGITSHTVKGKTAQQYTLHRKDGKRLTFLATWDLAQKIDRTMVGFPISVKFEKLHDSIERNGNRAKLFKVMVDRDAKPATGDQVPDITDEDVPF